MKYRSKTEIAAKMLEAANGGATKTEIMYNAFLSYNQLREYVEGTKTFQTTEKGLNFLKMHNESSELLQITN